MLIFPIVILAVGFGLGRCTAPTKTEKAIQAHDIAEALRMAATAIDQTSKP